MHYISKEHEIFFFEFCIYSFSSFFFCTYLYISSFCVPNLFSSWQWYCFCYGKWSTLYGLEEGTELAGAREDFFHSAIWTKYQQNVTAFRDGWQWRPADRASRPEGKEEEEEEEEERFYGSSSYGTVYSSNKTYRKAGSELTLEEKEGIYRLKSMTRLTRTKGRWFQSTGNKLLEKW